MVFNLCIHKCKPTPIRKPILNPHPPPNSFKMSSVEPIDVVALRKKFQQAGQSHVFHFWDDLSPSDQGALLEQLAELDVERVNAIYKRALEGEEENIEKREREHYCYIHDEIDGERGEELGHSLRSYGSRNRRRK